MVLFMRAMSLFLLLLFPSCLVTPAASPELKLRVMSYNVKHGLAMTQRPIAANLEIQAGIIRDQHPDLVGLQEIDQGCARSKGLDETGLFADLTRLRGAFGKFMDFDGGEYGLALLSRFPLGKVETLKLPPGKHEPRVALIHTFEAAPGITVVFVNVHFDWLRESKNRVRQAQALMNRLESVDLPVIVIGDYNARPDSPTIRVFRRAGFGLVPKRGSPFTFDSVNPSKEIDHLAIRGSGKYAIRADPIVVLDEKVASDHRPIVTNVYIKPR
jgi:endonuclease/exonuclease/phosphatase family metal-dependent hydrolase